MLDVSSKGEIALLLKEDLLFTTFGTGTLARVPMGGGVPRPVVADARAASWSPDGESLAVVRIDRASGESVLEYPVGNEIRRSIESMSAPAVSPDGEKVVVVMGVVGKPTINVVARDGSVQALPVTGINSSPRWLSNDRLLVSAGGNSIHLIDLAGNDRVVSESPGIWILDVRADGTALCEREIIRGSIGYGEAGATRQRELSWLDFPMSPVLTSSGKFLFTEVLDGGGPGGSMFLRDVDGSPALSLGQGFGSDISRDGKWVVSSRSDALSLVPTGVGTQRELRIEGMQKLLTARFVRHDRQLLVGGTDEAGAMKFVLHDLETDAQQPISMEWGSGDCAVSPDGESVAYIRSDGRLVTQALDATTSEIVKGSEGSDRPIQWSEDGRTLWVGKRDSLPHEVYTIDLVSGRRTLWRSLAPDDMAGVFLVTGVSIRPDGKAWAYSYAGVTDSDLYLAKLAGWE